MALTSELVCLAFREIPFQFSQSKSFFSGDFHGQSFCDGFVAISENVRFAATREKRPLYGCVINLSSGAKGPF